ncbi:hypothetical protein HMPREF9089_01152 [Eubacterium brachy ATCC 33089]|nr:hypothetical protein HMPREF9089_01152 [Eubacterium brachy ATCC 33089]
MLSGSKYISVTKVFPIIFVYHGTKCRLFPFFSILSNKKQ